jgi:ABC-type sugar transport system ATPase subunit
MIVQEVSLVKTLSMAENIFLGDLPRKGNSALVDWNTLYADTLKVLEKVGLEVSPKEKVSNLSVGQQQMLQLAKAISTDPKIIIMDEPTASLSGIETATLFEIIRELRAQNKSIIYISHRLEEIFEIADRVTVLRDGKVIDTVQASDVQKDDLISLMVGRYVNTMYKEKKHIKGNTVLNVKNLCKHGKFDQVSFDLKAGEILGVYGLVGAGRTELAWSLFGAYHHDSGEVYINGERSTVKSPEDAIQHGIIYLPEERKELSIVPLMTIKENITISSLREYSKFIFPSKSLEREVSEKYVNRLKIKITSLNQRVLNLSGGNQQKVTFSRLLALRPKIMILDEPTRGIDVGAKSEIHAIIEELAESGIGIIVISSELPEVMAISDRIMVMCLGKVTGIFPSTEDLTQQDLLRAACTE